MIALRSFKIQRAEGHARIVPTTDAAGCPFAGPGISLRGDEAAEAIRLAEPLVRVLAALAARAGVHADVRSFSVDRERQRVLVTFERGAPEGEHDPRALRIDDGDDYGAVLAPADGLLGFLAAQAEAALAKREGAIPTILGA